MRHHHSHSPGAGGVGPGSRGLGARRANWDRAAWKLAAAWGACGAPWGDHSPEGPIAASWRRATRAGAGGVACSSDVPPSRAGRKPRTPGDGDPRTSLGPGAAARTRPRDVPARSSLQPCAGASGSSRTPQRRGRRSGPGPPVGLGQVQRGGAAARRPACVAWQGEAAERGGACLSHARVSVCVYVCVCGRCYYRGKPML